MTTYYALVKRVEFFLSFLRAFFLEFQRDPNRIPGRNQTVRIRQSKFLAGTVFFFWA